MVAVCRFRYWTALAPDRNHPIFLNQIVICPRSVGRSAVFRDERYDAFAVVAVSMSAFRLSAAIRPSMPWLLRMAANSERRGATPLIAPPGEMSVSTPHFP